MKKDKPLPQIRMGAFKPVKYYEADITAPDACVAQLVALGRKVVTDDQLFNIGVNYAIMNAIDGKFELTSVDAPSVGTVIGEQNRQAHQKSQKKKQVHAKKHKGVLVDPPSGWQYGFPARYIKEEHGTMEQFLRMKKYPEKDIAFAMQNMRHIGEEE